MPFLLNEAPQELKDTVQAIENRADECYKLLRLLRRPANEARWALLTAMAFQLEASQEKFGANSLRHEIALVRLDRCTCGFKFISEYGRPVSRLIKNYTWHGSLIEDANHDLRVAEQYTHFLSVFPMWHKGHERADVQENGRLRFYIPMDSPQQRRVIAFQQRYRSSGSDPNSPYRGAANAESLESMKLLGDLWREARPTGTAKKFSYYPSRELIEALRPKYQDRLEENFRRPDDFRLNGYSLGEFKSFYVALLILCSIHEYICYPFDKPGQPIPVSSLVMVKPRSVWATRLSEISGLRKEVCDAIISDLTLDAVNQPGASMCIHPFVALDSSVLAVAPQFPLASAVDDNILRSFSYTYPVLFSAQNTDKESRMRERIDNAASPFQISHSIDLPDNTTEIDVLLSDEASSTVIFAELKWSRKPNRSLERIERDREIAKGLSQLKAIRSYARSYPNFLCERGKLPKTLDSYTNVHYLLVVWDHWYWIDPEDGIAVIHFDAFLPALKKHSNLRHFVAELLQYNWLPIEGKDFRISYSTSSVNGAAFESSIFSPVK